MRRRKFLTWIASLPIVATFFPKLVAEIRRPKTIDELRDFCRESLELQLIERFPDRRCEVVVEDRLSLVERQKDRLGLTSMLFNQADPEITDNNIEDHLNTCMSDIADSIKKMSTVVSSKTPDIYVRILSLDRFGRKDMANDRNGRALGLDDKIVVVDSGNWLILKWDIGSEGFFEWIRPGRHLEPVFSPQFEAGRRGDPYIENL